MSKKTNAAKLQARMVKPRKAHKRKGRKNPAFGKVFPPESGATLLGDPIFLHHVAGAILRALEIFPPSTKFSDGTELQDSLEAFTKPSGIQ